MSNIPINVPLASVTRQGFMSPGDKALLAAVAPAFSAVSGAANANVPSSARVMLLGSAPTAPVIWYLPQAASVAPGTAMLLGDYSGGLSKAVTLTVDCLSTTDALNGSTTGTLTLYTPYDAVAFVSDGVSNWSYVARPYSRSDVDSAIATALATATALAVAL